MSAGLVALSDGSVAVTRPSIFAPEGATMEPSCARSAVITVAENGSPALLSLVPSVWSSVAVSSAPTGMVRLLAGITLALLTSPPDSTVVARRVADAHAARKTAAASAANVRAVCVLRMGPPGQRGLPQWATSAPYARAFSECRDGV